MSFTKKAIGFLVALMLVAVMAQPALACTSSPPQPPPVWVVFHEVCCDFVNPNNCYIRAWIIFHNFSTFGANTGQFCSCALNKVGPILSIEKAELVNQADNTPIAGFCFQQADGANRQLGPDFQGFVSSISQNVPTGITTDLRFEVILQDGTTFNQLKNALASQGVVVTGEGNPDGSFTGHHQEFTTPGDIENGTGNGGPIFEPIPGEPVPVEPIGGLN